MLSEETSDNVTISVWSQDSGAEMLTRMIWLDKTFWQWAGGGRGDEEMWSRCVSGRGQMMAWKTKKRKAGLRWESLQAREEKPYDSLKRLAESFSNGHIHE